MVKVTSRKEYASAEPATKLKSKLMFLTNASVNPNMVRTIPEMPATPKPAIQKFLQQSKLYPVQKPIFPNWLQGLQNTAVRNRT
jgi:hypothetical protein